MSDKRLNIPPAFVAAAAANLLNCGITSLAGPVGYTQTQPYLVVRHIRLVNVTGGAVSATLYKGATGASAAGSQFAFTGVSIPANSYVDWFGEARFDAADFLTGVAGAANSIVINIDAIMGVV